MEKEEFENQAQSGDLVLVIIKEDGKYIDRFSRNTIHIGIYKPKLDKLDPSFDLSGILEFDRNEHMVSGISTGYHTCMYSSVESVKKIMSMDYINEILEQKLLNMGNAKDKDIIV